MNWRRTVWGREFDVRAGLPEIHRITQSGWGKAGAAIASLIALDH
jgi:hypothetical protein